MRKLGIPISKIKEYLEERSIDSLQALLQAKDRECEEIIAHNEKNTQKYSRCFSAAG